MKCFMMVLSFPLDFIISTAAFAISAIEYPTESIAILYLSRAFILSNPTTFTLFTLKYTMMFCN